MSSKGQIVISAGIGVSAFLTVIAGGWQFFNYFDSKIQKVGDVESTDHIEDAKNIAALQARVERIPHIEDKLDLLLQKQGIKSPKE